MAELINALPHNEIVNNLENHGIEYFRSLRGMVFTSYALKLPNKQDLSIDVFPELRGYVKSRSFFFPGKVNPRHNYRFIMTAGPFTKKRHNFFLVIPFRQIEPEEDINDIHALVPAGFSRMKWKVLRGEENDFDISDSSLANDLNCLILNKHKLKEESKRKRSPKN